MAFLADKLKEHNIEISEEVENELMKELVEKKEVDLKDTEISTLKEQIKTRDNDIEKLKKTDGTKLQEELANLQGKYKTDTEALQKKLDDNVLDNAIDKKVFDSKCKYPDIVKLLIDKNKLKLNNGNLEGFDEQMEVIKKDKADLFDVVSTETKKSAYEYKPNGGSNAGTDDNISLSDAVADALNLN